MYLIGYILVAAVCLFVFFLMGIRAQRNGLLDDGLYDVRLHEVLLVEFISALFWPIVLILIAALVTDKLMGESGEE